MKKYDVIIIGGGPAGLVASKILIAFGKKVAIIENNKLGGDCTHTGCIPSKTLLKAAKALYDAKQLYKYGIQSNPLEFDTSKVLDHVRSVVSDIYAHETPKVFESFGIDVIEGFASFISPHEIRVNDKPYKSKHFIIATGSGPHIPEIKGLDSVNYLTNENIFSLKSIPSSLMIIGTGVVAIEMATAFNRLGSSVTILSRGRGILKGNDEELSSILLEQLKNEGIKILEDVSFLCIEQNDNDLVLTIKCNNEEIKLNAKEILFATGRKANTTLGLENAGVFHDRKGIRVNNRLQTSKSHIYAIGDVSTPFKFTHIAEQEAIVAASNIGLPIKKSISYEHIGWCIYSDPEFAQIGFTYEVVKQKYPSAKLYSFEYKSTDRGYTDVDKIGKIKVVVLPEGTILGASILGSRAGELIHQLQLAKTFNISFEKLSKMVYIYPTYSDLIKQPAKQFYIQKLMNNPLLKFLKKIASFFKGVQS